MLHCGGAAGGRALTYLWCLGCSTGTSFPSARLSLSWPAGFRQNSLLLVPAGISASVSSLTMSLGDTYAAKTKSKNVTACHSLGPVAPSQAALSTFPGVPAFV